MRRRRRGGRSCQDLLEVVLGVLHQSTAWSTHHLWDSRVILHHSNCTSRSLSSSTLMLPINRSRQHRSSHHNSLHQLDTRASTAGKPATSPRIVVWSNKATHREPWHPRYTNRGANKGAQHHGLAAPTTPPWRRSP
jgi:hypothetical protein